MTKEGTGILSDIDWEAFKSGEKINIDSHQLMLLLGTMEAVRGSWRTMESPPSYRQKEQEKLSDSMQEGVGIISKKIEVEKEKESDFLRMDRELKLLNQAHHELISTLPELRNNLKHVEALVLVLKNLREMVEPGAFASLSVIISDIIVSQRKRFDKITGNIVEITKERDAGV